MLTHANAFPRKRFFLEMFTRDISVEDCLLDLIDNSIDALIRTRGIDLSLLLSESDHAPLDASQPVPVDLSLSAERITLADKCGGIPAEIVRDDLFGFGHTPTHKLGALGAYGIGMKRALFKLGNHFHLKSRTTTSGFEAELDVDKWATRDATAKEWQIPIRPLTRAKWLADAGTSIVISRLRPEVRQRLGDTITENRIRANISHAYMLFLQKYLRVTVNEKPVKPMRLPVGTSTEVAPGVQHYDDDHVHVTLMASLAAKDAHGDWKQEIGGWYVFCNARLVVIADKSDLTGWGAGLPQWHTKFRPFLGIAFFRSEDPLALPWTTTKRGLNRESLVFQRARDRMMVLARPVVDFLNDMYPSEPREHVPERDVAERLDKTSVQAVAGRPTGVFTATRRRRASADTVSVQFSAPKEAIEKIKKRLAKPNWSAGQIGRHCLDYFVKRECP